MRKIVWTSADDFFRSIFGEVDLVTTFPYEGFSQGANIGWLLYRLAYSHYVPGAIFRTIWFLYIIKRNRFKKNDVILCLNNAIWSPYWDVNLVALLRRKGCIVSALLLDALEAMDEDARNKVVSTANDVDVVFSYDRDNAQVHRWIYTDSYYSKPNVISEGNRLKIDVFCVMRVKARLKQAVAYYDALTGRGLKCVFYLFGVSDDEVIEFQREGIIYNQYLPYSELLGIISGAMVLLEIGADNSKNSTLRYYEAVINNKKLITTCKETKRNRFYIEKYMKIVSSPNDIYKIDDMFFSSENINYGYCDEFSPIRIFETITMKCNFKEKE